MNELKHLDLFSGIGGFSLAFEAEGFETIAFCEHDEIKRIVLRHWWPGVPILPDVKDTAGIAEFCRVHGPIALVTGGVPCQPTSSLGQQRGTADERWLWPDTIRVVGAVRPRFAVFENPPAILTLEGGRAWNGIVSGLVALGYDLWWDVFPAAAFGAGHLRERVLLVAADARHATAPAESQRQRNEVGREQFSGELRCGDAADNPGRQTHGRNGGSMEEEERGGESLNHAADLGSKNPNPNAVLGKNGLPGLEQARSRIRPRPLHIRSKEPVANADSLNAGRATGNAGSEGSEGSEGNKDDQAAELRCPEGVVADAQGVGKSIPPNETNTVRTRRNARPEPTGESDSRFAPDSNRARLQGQSGHENRGRGGANEKRPITPADLRGRVFATQPGEPAWWNEAYTGVPVLAHGLPNKLVEAATRCTGDAVVPQVLAPIAKAIKAHLSTTP